MKGKDTVVMYESPEAATFRTDICGWVDIKGHSWGEGPSGERAARYASATHRLCGCGAVIDKGSVYCRGCLELRRLEEYAKRPTKEWDGEYLYSEHLERFMSDADEAHEVAETHGVSVADLYLVICDPQYCFEIDPAEHYADILPEDGDESYLPDAVVEAFAQLNAVIRANQTPVSWYPGKYAPSLPLEKPKAVTHG